MTDKPQEGASPEEQFSVLLGYDFGGVHPNFHPEAYFPPGFKRHLLDIGIAEGNNVESDKVWINTQSLMHQLVRSETNLRPTIEQIAIPHLSTSQSIMSLVDYLLKDERELALPVPNWGFWDIKDRCKKEYPDRFNFGFRYFEAFDEEQLVNNFERAAKEGNVGALILVNPSNPMLYPISEQTAKRIDKIAKKKGISVVLDDIFMGTQPIDQRNSIGEFFTNPYIVQGFSKRFNNVFANAYVILPKDFKVRFKEHSPKCICGDVFWGALRYAGDHAIEELKIRNELFDEGIKATCPDTKIIRPSETHCLSLLELPKGVNSLETAIVLNEQGIQVVPMSSFFPPEHPMPEMDRQLIRVTVSNMGMLDIAQGAHHVGEIIRSIQTSQ